MISKFYVVADLTDGQTGLHDEGHVGMYSGQTLTATEAADAIEHLNSDRPDGHENVSYRIVEVA